MTTCNYCGLPANKIMGSKLYPHSPQNAHKTFWRCGRCDAHVGCHPSTDLPLGTLANAPLRKARQQAHKAFDRLWKSGEMTRKDAYAWLRSELGDGSAAHMGSMDERNCARVIAACARRSVSP